MQITLTESEIDLIINLLHISATSDDFLSTHYRYVAYKIFNQVTEIQPK